ncbi:MAG: molybdopterin-guanine dinucleotide biosynthesis protein B [Bacillota bacterium]|nr:molybdopterin-guanine dinucleotide biosynthesis protein B [Bacillota bacterium]
MALVEPVIFQIVGYQNSGKTTVVTKVINRLHTKGFKVVSIKHHGHGGKPDVYEQKDSSRHIQFGAVASIVEGDGRLLLQSEQDTWSLNEKISLMKYFTPDLILIEGYKKEIFPKLIILKDEDEARELLKLDNIQFLLVWNERLQKYLSETTNISCYHIHDENGIDKIVNFLERQICSKN